MENKIVCIVGLGYVGLPLAKAFSKHLKTIGFDVDNEKIRLLNNDNEANLEFTTDPSKIEHADFVIIAVPTPVTKSKEPDLRYVKLFCFAKTFTKNAYAIFCFAKRNISLVKFLKLFKRKVCDKRVGTEQRELCISYCMGVVEDCSVRSRTR